MDSSQLGKKILENAALSDGLMSRDCCYKSQMLESKFGIKNMKNFLSICSVSVIHASGGVMESGEIFWHTLGL